MLLTLALATQTWTMVVGGDIMLNAVAPSSKTFLGIESWTRSADIATANLEIPLTNSKSPTPRKSAADVKAKKQFILKADPRHAQSIAKAGFDLVGLGNNHAMDYGLKGLDQMTMALGKYKVSYCGASSDSSGATAPAALVVKGVRVAFVSFLAFQTERALYKCTYSTSKSPGVSTLLHLEGLVEPAKGKKKGDPIRRLTKQIVQAVGKDADVVVVWLHWGTERKTVPDPYQVRLGRAFVEAGADCVLGAHPHVLQGAELYAGRPIFYSLGNLVSPLPASTAVFRLTFKGDEFQGAEMLPCNIRGGKVEPVALSLRQAAKKRFAGLGNQLIAKYKNSKCLALAPK